MFKEEKTRMIKMLEMFSLVFFLIFLSFLSNFQTFIDTDTLILLLNSGFGLYFIHDNV